VLFSQKLQDEGQRRITNNQDSKKLFFVELLFPKNDENTVMSEGFSLFSLEIVGEEVGKDGLERREDAVFQ